MNKKTIKAAFPHTLPVFMGYLFLGIAFGVLLASKGFHVGWAILMSVTIYAGSMQFVAVSYVVAPFQPLSVVLITLMVNARHIFYGLSMLEKFKGCGKLKYYMIFGLTDETYSLLCSAEPPEGVERKWFMFWITLFDHCYWILGGAIGCLAGTLIRFDSTGIDFAMTALFIVIMVEQWESTTNHLPVLIGIGSTILCRVFAGEQWFIIASMAVILLSLILLRPFFERKGKKVFEEVQQP
ncbi:MAG: AzlC family ABC transporter permease [Lachnospiraceae bacterium]|nr:AzlC family ABC transporter permease [Lachnospiraceae bacterium]